MLSLIGPGEVVGLVRLLKVGARLYDYHAHEDTVLVHLPSEAQHAVLDQTSLLWKDVALLAEQGILAPDYGQLTILDLPALRRIAEGR